MKDLDRKLRRYRDAIKMLIKNFGGTAMRNKIKITIKQVAVTLFMHSDVFEVFCKLAQKPTKKRRKRQQKLARYSRGSKWCDATWLVKVSRGQRVPYKVRMDNDLLDVLLQVASRLAMTGCGLGCLSSLAWGDMATEANVNSGI